MSTDAMPCRLSLKKYGLVATAFAQALAETRSASEMEGVLLAIDHVTHALQFENSRFQPGKFKALILAIERRIKS